MAFGIGINTEQPDTGKVKGRQQSIACDCWFTSQGKVIPRWIKYEDEEGVIQILPNIRVISSEKKRYCGISMMEYQCSAEVEGREYLFRLLFNYEECTWKLLCTSNEDHKLTDGKQVLYNN